MRIRREKNYIKMPAFAARLYDNLTSIKGIDRSFEEIADFMVGILPKGRLLDVGTGQGLLIIAISNKNPALDLSGIDTDDSMLAIARQNIRSIKGVDLRIGNIRKTEYADDFFDCIVSAGNFHGWENPAEGLDEIFRILKPGTTAYLFDTHRDYHRKVLRRRLAVYLDDYPFIRKRVLIHFLKRQLRMAYSLPEIEAIIKQTKFRNSYSIREIELGNLPMYVRMELKKE